MDGVSGSSGGGDIGGTVMEIVGCVLQPHKLIEKLLGLFGGDSVSQSQQASTGTQAQLTEYQEAWKDFPGYVQGRSKAADEQAVKDLEIIEKNWDKFDTANGKEAKDGKVSLRELGQIANDQSLPTELRAAAQRLMDSPELTNQLDLHGTGKLDGSFTLEDVKAIKANIMQKAGLQSMDTPEQTTPAQQGPTRREATLEIMDQDKGISPSVAQSQSAMTSVLDDPSISFEGKTNYLCSEALQSTENQAVDAYREYEAAFQQLDKAQSEADITKANAAISRLNNRVQQAIQRRQEMYQMMSNINSMSHDMAMAAIRNMKD